jgi:uncharacterized protein Smg (DUF494 family)
MEIGNEKSDLTLYTSEKCQSFEAETSNIMLYLDQQNNKYSSSTNKKTIHERFLRKTFFQIKSFNLLKQSFKIILRFMGW